MKIITRTEYLNRIIELNQTPDIKLSLESAGRENQN